MTAGHGPAPSGVCRLASQLPSGVGIETSRRVIGPPSSLRPMLASAPPTRPLVEQGRDSTGLRRAYARRAWASMWTSTGTQHGWRSGGAVRRPCSSCTVGSPTAPCCSTAWVTPSPCRGGSSPSTAAAMGGEICGPWPSCSRFHDRRPTETIGVLPTVVGAPATWLGLATVASSSLLVALHRPDLSASFVPDLDHQLPPRRSPPTHWSRIAGRAIIARGLRRPSIDGSDHHHLEAFALPKGGPTTATGPPASHQPHHVTLWRHMAPRRLRSAPTLPGSAPMPHTAPRFLSGGSLPPPGR